MKTWALLLLTLVVARTLEADGVERGQPAPLLDADDWVKHEKLDPKVLRGRVIALAFVRINDMKCLEFLEQWDKVRQEFALEPVTFLAVTNETPEFVRKHSDIDKVPSPTMVNQSNSVAKGFEVTLFPSVAIIDTRGVIAYIGKPPEMAIVRDTLFTATETAQWFAPLPKKWSSIQKTAEKFEYGHAIEAIDKALPNVTDAAEKTTLESTKALFVQIGAGLAEAATVADKNSDWLMEVVALKRLNDDFVGNVAAARAKEDLATLTARTDVKDEVDAALEYSKAERYEREKNWKAATRAFESLAKAKPNTAAGKKASDLAKYLAKKKS